ncbi:MAG: hypothetical protein IT385_27945 [Deltaproteobacteria bacterium]|nr:hypothetical protein [Deltaproteobacteria bacterium]
MRLAWMGWAWVGLVGLGACRSEEGDEPYMPPTFPPPPPPEMRMDAASGAILARSPTWAWLEGDALRARSERAVLGLSQGARCEGWVEVVEGETARLEVARRALEARRAEGGWEVHMDEDALYASHTARRWEIQKKAGTVVESVRASFLVEGPRLFVVSAVARDPEYTRRRRCLDAVTAAFDVMPWEPPEAGKDADAAAQPDAPGSSE